MRNTKYTTMSDIINDWLKEYSGRSYYKHREGLIKFLSFLKKDVDQVMREYKEAEDRTEWAKSMGLEVVKFYNHLIQQGYSINSARTWSIYPRAFFSAKCIQVKIKRGSIAKAQVATGEHPFVQRELQKMFFYANTFDKAVLSLGVSIGFGSTDFLELRRSDIEGIVNYAIENEQDFPYFDYNRGKTKTQGRAFLMPEAIKSLKTYLEVTEPNEKDQLFDLSQDALNDHLRRMVKASAIRTRGKVKWHLLRKFLFSNLLKAMDLMSAKLIIAKSVGADLLTYLIQHEGTLQNRFKRAYPYIRLAQNGDRISKAEENLEMYRKLFRKMILDSGLLKDISEDLSDEDVLRLYLQK